MYRFEDVPDERESTIAPEEVEKILDEAYKKLPELRERLEEVFRPPDRKVLLD